MRSDSHYRFNRTTNNFPLTGNELLQFKFGTPAQIDITILKNHLWLFTR